MIAGSSNLSELRAQVHTFGCVRELPNCPIQCGQDVMLGPCGSRRAVMSFAASWLRKRYFQLEP